MSLIQFLFRVMMWVSRLQEDALSFSTSSAGLEIQQLSPI
jgi:hypothetical protein